MGVGIFAGTTQVYSVQRRPPRPTAARSMFVSLLAGLTMTIASTCLQADTLSRVPLPEDGDGGFAAMAQNAVPADTANITVIADASTTPGLIRDMVTPLYPEEARRDRVEGYVVVQFDIAGNGKVSGVRVLEAKPANYFETAAIDAVSQLQFSPNEKPVDAVAIRGAVNMFVFSLKGSNTPKPGFITWRGRSYFAAAN